MKKDAFRKIFAVILIAALVFTFTVPVSATGAPEEVYTPAEVTVPEAPDDIPESVAEPTGEQLALNKDISVPEPTESVSETEAVTEEETEAPVVPSDEAAFEEPLDELLPEETIAEATVAEEPQEAPIEAVLEQEEIVYNTSALTLNNLPEYIVNNTLEKDIIAVGLAQEDAQQLNSFTTINSDGTNTLYLFGAPIKYVDKNTNQIKFIDNSIVPVLAQSDVATLVDEDVTLQQNAESITTISGYANAANSFSVNMPASVNEGISLVKEDLTVTLYPADPAISIATINTMAIGGVSEQVVNYSNALGNGIHQQYVPINNGIKENIILDNYTGVNTFNFVIEAQGYYPLYSEGEAIPFVKEGSEEIAFILGQVDARDSYVGEETDGHFTLYNSISLIEIKSGIYGLTVIVDPDFLNNPETVYPVVIDPTITISSSYMQDTTVYSGHPNKQTYYSSAYNIVGYHGSTAGTGTAFIKTTNLSAYNYILPGNINSATYRVYEGSGKTNTVQVILNRLFTSWEQNTITYSNMPHPDYSSALIISNSGWKNFDLTNIIKKMLSPVDGYDDLPESSGFALTAYDSSSSSLHFCSANHGTYAPSITINYNTSYTVFDVDAVYNPINDTKFKAMGYLIHGHSPEFKIKISYSGVYHFETVNSVAYFGHSSVPQDTQLKLLNNNGSQIAFNDNISSTNSYSKITISLTAGTYYLRVLNSSGTMSNIACYLTVQKDGELSQPSEFYANHTRDFYKIDNATSTYNCLAYVLRDRTRWIGLQTSVTGATNQLIAEGASTIPTPSDSCIILYGYSNYSHNHHVTHVAVIENGSIKAKMSTFERVRHSVIDAYFDFQDNSLTNSCGFPIKFFTDVA